MGHVPDKNQFFGGKYALECGKKAQEEYGARILELFRKGNGYLRIAQELNFDERFEVECKSTLIGIVRSALVGNAASNQPGPNFTGIIGLDELAKLAREHRLKEDLKKRANGTGIYGISREKRKEIYAKSLETRHAIAWLPEQIDYIYDRLHEEDAWKDSEHYGVRAELLAQEINHFWYLGREVRNGTQISNLISRTNLKDKLESEKGSR